MLKLIKKVCKEHNPPNTDESKNKIPIDSLIEFIRKTEVTAVSGIRFATLSGYMGVNNNIKVYIDIQGDFDYMHGSVETTSHSSPVFAHEKFDLTEEESEILYIEIAKREKEIKDKKEKNARQAIEDELQKFLNKGKLNENEGNE